MYRTEASEKSVLVLDRNYNNFNFVITYKLKISIRMFFLLLLRLGLSLHYIVRYAQHTYMSEVGVSIVH